MQKGERNKHKTSSQRNRMTPQPLDGAAGPSPGIMAQLAQQQQQDGPRPGSISLTMLIEFIIQRTYHDLTVLAELLPRKTDMERKIEIYNFSARTRQLFIRLLALVKWASSASKVDKSANIMTFLDKQSMLFIDTADALTRMSRETLVNAMLPNFNIPAAVEILTTGNYTRLPTCIKERILPPDPINASDKKQTLHRLNQVIQHRLVTGNLMPQMNNFHIENGRVQFRVENEFEVGLTLMGDTPNVPWRLLEIEILVVDKETGNGKELVHMMQIGYIHQLIQARLVDNPEALSEVYNCLHYFCQSLQLEVLFSQTMHLKQNRLNENVHVEEYVRGSKLSVSYWRELSKKDPKSELGYRLTIQSDPTDKAKPLAVFHRPSIGNKESSDMADRAVRSDMLSMERLLVHTVYIRSLARLIDIKGEFQSFLKDVDYNLEGTPAILTVPILQPCLPSEQLHITVDTHTGTLKCHVPKHMDCPVVVEMQMALNSEHAKIPALVSKMRFWLTKRKCEKTLQNLPAVPFEHLPLQFDNNVLAAKISKHRLYVRLNRHSTVILVVEIKESLTTQCEMELTYYIAFVRNCTVDDDVVKPPAQDDDQEQIDITLPKVFIKVLSLLEFDSFVATHGPSTAVFGPPGKKARIEYPAYSIPELAHVVSLCDDTLPFVALAQEFSIRQIPHSGVQTEINTTNFVIKLLSLPQPMFFHSPPDAHMRPQVMKALTKRLLSVSVRTQLNKNMHTKSWSVELVFFGSPLPTLCYHEQAQRRCVYLSYEMGSTDDIGLIVDAIILDWSKIVFLYRLVHEFSMYYNNDDLDNDATRISSIVTVKSFTYSNLVLGYGPNHEVTVNVFWCTEAKEFKLIFTGSGNSINAHSIMVQQLKAHLNFTHDLYKFVHTLHETYFALTSVSRLAIIPHLGIPRPQVPVLSFCILPQSPNLLRVAYQAMYCLEISLRGGGLVSIRDGAHSRFNKVATADEFTPTQGLKSFLLNYVDESAVHIRRTKWEEDQPSSPVVADDGPAASSFQSNRAPQSPRNSNPQTPASPHTISQQQQSSPIAVQSPSQSSNHGNETVSVNVNSPATTANWPGSPSVARPSPRPDEKNTANEKQPDPPVQTQRSWANAVPTLLTHEALETLCFPGPHPESEVPGPDLSPLERFLGCVYMRRNLQRFIQSEELLEAIKCDSPGMVVFTVDSLQCQIVMNPKHMQSLQIKVSQAPPKPDAAKPHVEWSLEDMRTIEKFFEWRVASPPYRPCSLYGFCRMLKVPPQVLKDFLQIIRVELQPDLLPDIKWNVKFLVRVPPASPPIVPTGSAAIHTLRLKTLFFLQISHIPPETCADHMEPPSLVLPMVYDLNSNITQLAERRETTGVVLSSATNSVNTVLRRYAECHTANAGADVCSIFPAVKDLLQNLMLPPELQPVLVEQTQQPSQANKITVTLSSLPEPAVPQPETSEIL